VPPVLRRTDWFLRGAVLKAWNAFRERRLPWSPAWWLKALSLHWRETAQRPRSASPEPLNQAAVDASYARWLRARAAAPEARRRTAGSAVPSVPVDLVAIVGVQTDVPAVIRSILAQPGAPGFRALVWDDVSASDLPSETATGGSAVRRVPLRQIIRSDGSWLPPGDSPHVVMLDATTLLAPGALPRVAQALQESNTADWIYSDDDRLDPDGVRRDPYCKGQFDRFLALSDDYATRLAVVRRSAINRVGGLQSARGDAQIYDLLLRVAESGGRVAHIAEVCCHRTRPVAGQLSPQLRSVAEQAVLSGASQAAIHVEAAAPSGAFQVQRIVWKKNASAMVTIVIPTRDRVDLLEPCVDSIRRTVEPRHAELLIVDDRSTEESTATYLEQLSKDTAFRCRVIRPAAAGPTFNYARLMNMADREIETDFVLHLNNDVVAIAPGWLNQMTGWLSFPEVGVVGARLLYADGSLQHAGVVVSPGSGVLEHFQHHLIAGDRGYQWLPHRAREVSAVTGACFLTRTDLFRALGGFDDRNFAVQFNDIDFCLRARQAGGRVVCEPAAVLYHRTSASRGHEYDHRESMFFLERYRAYRDPFVSAHFNPVSLCEPTPRLEVAR
jgi:GT2 family glycosyltransferase